MTQYPKKSSWIMCFLNECSSKGDPKGETIKRLVKQILDETQGRMMWVELVLVNNASTDNTMRVLQEIRAEHLGQITVLDEPMQGKARAERRGFEHVIRQMEPIEAIVTLDADGEHEISDMLAMYEMYKNEGVACVVGSRFMKNGKRNKKDEILRGLLVSLSDANDQDVPNDPRCGARIYDPQFIAQIVPRTVSMNYGLQYEIIALGLMLLQEGKVSGKIMSHGLDHYAPHRSKVFKKKPQTQTTNPELSDLCCAISNVFGAHQGEAEGREIVAKFGVSIGRPNLFIELSELFFKGKMVTDHGASAPQEFMEAPPTV